MQGVCRTQKENRMPHWIWPFPRDVGEDWKGRVHRGNSALLHDVQWFILCVQGFMLCV